MSARPLPISERNGYVQLQTELSGAEVVLHCQGSAYFPSERMLVISDLHLEKGSSLARRGMLIPPYDTHQTLKRLTAVIDYYDPRAIVSLGDSFHDCEGHLRLAAEMRTALCELAAGRQWYWIAGNHDPYAPPGLPGISADALAVGGIVFRHEPAGRAEAGEVAGHLHPCARVRRRGRIVRRPCFAFDGVRMILPAFGAYTGSINVRSSPFDGLFDLDKLHAHMLGADRIYPMPARLLIGD